MRGVILKITGLFVTFFAFSQLGHAEKANAKAPEASNLKQSLETTSHGCGCGCSSCLQPSETADSRI
ncbi:MAG: hypothetical protein HRT94_04495 [Alphaproteobacteria bacterium]|nr:hypothetical protein [Alphaproteobacteria bacterium]